MNYIQIAGRIGKDPEVRYTPDNKKVTSFNVATNKKKKGQDITTWYRVTIWGDQFDRMMPYLKKGSAVMVVGDLETRIYTDKENRPQISHDVTAWNISFSPFGKGSDGESSSSNKDEFASSESMKGSLAPSFNGHSSGQSDYEGDDGLPF